MLKSMLIKDENHSSQIIGLRWLRCGLDFIKKRKSVTLIQFGILSRKRVAFLGIVQKKANPYPTFLVSWSWSTKFLAGGRIIYGTTTKPIKIIKRMNTNGIQVRRRTVHTRLGGD